MMPNPIATIYRPTQAQGADGQPQGQDVVWMRDVPLKNFKTLSVSEPETAGQQGAVAVHSFEIWGNPEKPLQHTDYLTIGPRRLNISQIIDDQQNGQRLTLICGEESR